MIPNLEENNVSIFEKIKVGLVVIWGFLLPALFIYGEVVGIYHSFSEHSKDDEWQAIYFPPLAWYRAVEIYWHTEDWENIILQETRTLLTVIGSSKDINQNFNNPKMDSLSKKIFDYPDEQVHILKNNAKTIIRFYLINSQDMLEDLDSYLETENLLMIRNDQAVASFDSLKAIGLEAEADYIDGLYNEVTTLLEKQFQESDKDDFYNHILENYNYDLYNMTKLNYAYVYQVIFNEKLVLE